MYGSQLVAHCAAVLIYKVCVVISIELRNMVLCFYSTYNFYFDFSERVLPKDLICHCGVVSCNVENYNFIRIFEKELPYFIVI